jgi:hypothetical protein
MVLLSDGDEVAQLPRINGHEFPSRYRRGTILMNLWRDIDYLKYPIDPDSDFMCLNVISLDPDVTGIARAFRVNPAYENVLDNCCRVARRCGEIRSAMKGGDR